MVVCNREDATGSVEGKRVDEEHGQECDDKEVLRGVGLTHWVVQDLVEEGRSGDGRAGLSILDGSNHHVTRVGSAWYTSSHKINQQKL